jgi:hypothetical protein
MAKALFRHEIRLPAYAASYLINDDSSGLESDDKKNIDQYMESFYQLADLHNAYVTIDITGDEPYFTSCPAFGLACDVVDCTIYIMKF